MQLSDKLQALRLQHGLSQEELADRLHVARQTIGKWESGQSQPGLDSLLALGQLYSMPLDYLLRADDCAAMHSTAISPEPLTLFLLQAKRSTYAAHGLESAPSRPDSHDFLFVQGPWRYLDSYVGGSRFIGEEIVWHDEQPIWGMNYAGQVTGAPFSGDFLKQALMQVSPSMPYRGPQLYRHGSWTYHCHVDGTVDWFSGHEDIYFETEHIYTCLFHGGKLG